MKSNGTKTYAKELAGLEALDRLTVLNKLGDDAAGFLRKHILSALEHYQHVFVLTHVPPFKDACRHQNKVADDNWLPHFSCMAVGNVLLEIMQKHPDCAMTVLCRHTHHSAVVQICPILLVKTGQAEYGSPRLQELLLAK